MNHSSQFQLLKQKRFLPFFLTQFFGAFNDNVFKNALGILVTYKIAADSATLLSVAAGLFILPFFLFSAIAGQLADKYEKSRLIKTIKLFEILIMAVATLGFYTENIYLLMTILFLMGTQSSLFGPVKYGYLPQKLSKTELIGGNAMIESSTFLAILIGTIAGTLLLNFDSYLPVTVTILFLAVAGYFSARSIPNTPSAAPNLKLNYNIFSETVRNIKFLPSNRVVFLSILAISWFWFYGSIFLIQIQNYTKNVLFANESVVAILLSAFSIGIALGSLLCEKFSGRRVEIGLVPLGAIGMSYFGYDLAMTSQAWPTIPDTLSASGFLDVKGSYWILFNMLMVGVSGGFYIVPLYALVQERSDSSHLSRVIAGNNIINSIFMVIASVMTWFVLVKLGYSIPQLFLITAVLNIIVCVYIFTVVPEFLIRLFAWLLISTIYRVKPKGLENIPAEGPALLACNHISFVDPMILGGYIRRPVRFVMYHKIYNIPVLKWIFKAAKTIPIAAAKEDPEMFEQAFKSIKASLADGDVVCIFPEGKLTPDGSIQEFKSGIERIVKETPIDVIPMALFNLWGSLFSREAQKIIDRRPKKLFAKISIEAGESIPYNQVTKETVQNRVQSIKDKLRKAHEKV